MGKLRKKGRAVFEKGIKWLTPISPTLVSRIRYRQGCKRRLNLKNPQEFNEKMMWLKLNTYYKNPLVIQCADKVRVRDYIRERGCEEILIDCIGVYDRAEEIPWEQLPGQFVLKCNHGAGYNIICTDKNRADLRSYEKKLSDWLKEDYSLTYAEMQYHYIKPKIICEKYLRPVSGVLPEDYKVYCFDGKAVCVMLCSARETGQSRFYFFDRDWKPLDWGSRRLTEEVYKIERPACLDALFSYAEKLSEGFPFVRMDLYVMDNKVYFGEMTFTPSGCLAFGYTEEGNRELSRRLKLGVSDV